MIRTPSMSGQEASLANLLLAEMRRVGFDAAWTDEAGNAFGLYKGTAAGPAWLLLTHLDHIDVGDLNLWPHPPFDAVLENGFVYGRGAVDIKGPLAAHVGTIAEMAKQNLRPKHDIIVAAVTWEEHGGEGAQHLVDNLPLVCPDGVARNFGACIVAEPSNNRVMIGHRGVARATVTLQGKAHHASLALQEQNPHFALAELLKRLEKITLPTHTELGQSSIAPTVIRADTASDNLTPNQIELVLDWRTTTETADDIERILNELIKDLPAKVAYPRTWQIENKALYTPGFYIPTNHALVEKLFAAVKEKIPSSPVPAVWWFATDGRFTHKAGIPTVGFGPGAPELAHTTEERIAVKELEQHVEILVPFLLNANFN